MVQEIFATSVATWKRPTTMNNNNGPAFKARPIRHWRKQLSCDKYCEAVYSINRTKSVCHITRQASTVVGPLKKCEQVGECEPVSSEEEEAHMKQKTRKIGAVSSSARILKIKEDAIRSDKNKPIFILNTPCQRTRRQGNKTLCF